MGTLQAHSHEYPQKLRPTVQDWLTVVRLSTCVSEKLDILTLHPKSVKQFHQTWPSKIRAGQLAFDNLVWESGQAPEIRGIGNGSMPNCADKNLAVNSAFKLAESGSFQRLFNSLGSASKSNSSP